MVCNLDESDDSVGGMGSLMFLGVLISSLMGVIFGSEEFFICIFVVLCIFVILMGFEEQEKKNTTDWE